MSSTTCRAILAGSRFPFAALALFALCCLFSFGTPGTLASQAPAGAFDYGEDVEPVPATISIGLEAGEYKVVDHSYRGIKRTHTGSIIRMQNFNTTTSPGDPMLPVRIVDIAVPPNIDWKTLEVSYDTPSTTLLEGEYDLVPAPPRMTRIGDEELLDWGEGKDIIDERNLAVYGKDEFFPAEAARIVEHSQMRKWKFVRLEYSPFQYNPVTRRIRATGPISIELDFMRIGERAYRSDSLLLDTAMDKEAADRFINFKDALDWYRYVPPPAPGAAVEDPDYVILTTNAIRDNSTKLADFVAHKADLGFLVQVVTEDDYGVTGDANAIRSWLSSNYETLGIHYLLLIGDPDPDNPDLADDSVGDVPMLMTWPRRYSYRAQESATDYYYADLTGNWDLDGDGRYGEYTALEEPTSPDPAVDPDTFSVRWTGKIQVDVEGVYLFVAVSDNGMRVSIGGTVVLDNMTSHTVEVDYIYHTLTAGQHDIQVDYFDDTGDAVATLYWRPPGDENAAQIPSANLYHLDAGSYVAGGLNGEYFNNIDFTAPVLTRVDPSVRFVWASGDRGLGGVEFAPELYVGRIPVYDADYVALDSILQKIIDYETGPAPAWRGSLLTANVDLELDWSDYLLGEALKADFTDPLGYPSYRIYEDDFGIVPAPECPAINPKDPDPVAPCNMLGEWTNRGGYGLVTWSTHGGETGAAHLMESADATHLDDSAPAFTFQGSCKNGFPENANNLGYSLLRNGAIATVSASRSSWNSVFHPSRNPNPDSGSNTDLTYHYAMRILENQPAGHALYVTKARVNPDDDYMNKMDYNLYGDPSVSLMRSLTGVALLFDTSGSMSWNHQGGSAATPDESRLALAKEAANAFMELLDGHAHTRSNFGVAVFPPHPWDLSVGCNGQVVTPMTPVDDASTATAVGTTIPGLVADGNTPLLAGLSTALDAFGDETPKAIVLLSDGYHNCPSSVGAFDPQVDTVIDSLNAASMRVYTIGFGRPTDIDPPFLTRLAEETGGNFHPVTTPDFDPESWSPGTELQATYKAILTDALNLDTAIDPLGVVNAGDVVQRQVSINEHDRRVSIFLSWRMPRQNRLALNVKTSDNQPMPDPTATPGITVHQGRTYSIVTLDREFLNAGGKVGPNPWLVEIDGGSLRSGETEHYQYSVIVDSGLTMDVALGRDDYRVGDALLVTARIAAAGQPVTGLSDVRVSVSKPGEGLGNWFALNRVSAAELERIPVEKNGEALSRVQRKAMFLTDIRQIAPPLRLQAGEMPLFDDGSHGDAVADDGVYTATVTDTGKEGTYRFHVVAEGPTAAGNGFEREGVLEKHLTPRVSAAHLGLAAVRLDSADAQTLRYLLTITPRDASGNYLGPRYAGAITLSASEGVQLGAVTDNLDGSYSQELTLPADLDLRDVRLTLSAQDADTAFVLADVTDEADGDSLRLIGLIILILLVLALLFFLMRRRP